MMRELDESKLLQFDFGEAFVFDVESYPNYFMCGFMHINTGAYYFIESGFGKNVNIKVLNYIMSRFCLVSFNGISYDEIILALALNGYGHSTLFNATQKLIIENYRRRDIEDEYKVKVPKTNHIDLIEVCPLSASLKVYAGRLHCRKMQDLPYEPGTMLTEHQANEVKSYNVNDLENTRLIARELTEQISLRYNMSRDYGIDVRSKSDAQIAEAVISSEVTKIAGRFPSVPKIAPGTLYKYNVPEFIDFKTDKMNSVLETIRNIDFELMENGSFVKPNELKELDLIIGNAGYSLGIGGLHSKESCITHRSDEHYKLIDRDVASYYPRIILILKLFPKHIGEAFLRVYNSLVEKRLAGKKAGNNIIADALKIVINGSFGKFGSKYSVLYSPDLMLAVTITGQLSLLMLIEEIELAGISVVSANTDGIVIKCPRNREDELNQMVFAWEAKTGFETEPTEYSALCSRDVNNYIAVKSSGGCKGKGAYSNHWNDKKSAIFRFHKNPETLICIDAVYDYLSNGTPIEKTIHECKDITKFVSIRSVKGGAVKDGMYLGKAVRWYHPIGEYGCLKYKTSGNKVATTDRARPLMDLPDEFPSDIDYDFYIEKANSILYDIGFKKRNESLFF